MMLARELMPRTGVHGFRFVTNFPREICTASKWRTGVVTFSRNDANTDTNKLLVTVRAQHQLSENRDA